MGPGEKRNINAQKNQINKGETCNTLELLKGGGGGKI
jgi:hypothetical protein